MFLETLRGTRRGGEPLRGGERSVLRGWKVKLDEVAALEPDSREGSPVEPLDSFLPRRRLCGERSGRLSSIEGRLASEKSRISGTDRWCVQLRVSTCWPAQRPPNFPM